MTLTGTSHAEELIACAAAVPVADASGQPLRRIRMLPAGLFKLKDERGPFNVDPARVVVAARKYWGNELMPFDFDHQTLATVTKGGQGGTAPASAWVDPAKLTAEADGVYANDIDWTPAAAARIAGREYRYFSPVMGTSKSGDVTGLYGGGLTNDPAIGGLTAIAASSFHPKKETDMSLLNRLVALYALAATATEDEVFTAASAQHGHLTGLRTALGAKADDSHETVIAAAATLKTAKTAGAGDVIVPASTWADTQTRLQALEDKDIVAAVDQGQAEGKIVPASRESMLSWARKDFDAFKSFIATAPVIVAAGAVRTGQPSVEGEQIVALSAEMKSMAALTGVSEDEMLITLKGGAK